VLDLLAQPAAGANSGNGANAFITMITFDPEE
jgi:hypothetical protein